MQHTLIAVFDNRSDAQSAMTELLDSGFDRSGVRLSDETSSMAGGASAADVASTPGEGIGASIKHFFQDLFGDDDDHLHSQKYSTAITRGHHVLTVTAGSEPEVERAADIVERFGPVDIDEKAAEWGTGAGTDATRMGSTGAMQGSQSAPSMQSQTLQQGSTQSGSMSGGTMGASQQRGTESAAIPVVEEKLKVGKREVQRGGVRVYSRVVETPVNESVSLREEHVNVERRPVDQPLGTDATAAFKEQTIELRETAEEAVVQKTARVVEEVVVGKDVTQRQQGIQDTVRHTEVEVEQLGADTTDNESAWRSHWTSNYGSTSGNYDEYAPAYSYGNDMAGQYRGRQWNEVESDLRTNWESRNPGASTWDKFKGAIRHGWDRMTSRA